MFSGRIKKIILLLLILVTIGVVFFCIPKTKPIEKPFKDMLGANFVVGFMGNQIDKNTEEIIRYIKPAGVILYARNCQNSEQLKNLIDSLQKIAKETIDYKFFVMIDEEPGGASRLGTFDDVFDSGEPNWSKINNNIRVLSNIGINVNLAPVCDYPFNGDTFIKERIPAKSIENLISFNKSFIEISEKNNVSTVLKHFPGMGFFTIDPHKQIPSLSVEKSSFNKSLDIFKKGVEAGSKFVMTDHAFYTDVDKNMASLSSKIIKDILIDKVGFKGIVITDDMSDMPILVGSKLEIDEATIDALKAGNNLVMFSHRPEATKEIFDSVLSKALTDKDFQEVVRHNYQKITDFKKGNPNYSFK